MAIDHLTCINLICYFMCCIFVLLYCMFTLFCFVFVVSLFSFSVSVFSSFALFVITSFVYPVIYLTSIFCFCLCNYVCTYS